MISTLDFSHVFLHFVVYCFHTEVIVQSCRHPWSLPRCYRTRYRPSTQDIPTVQHQLVEQTWQYNSFCYGSQLFQEQTTKNVVERWVCLWALAPAQ